MQTIVQDYEINAPIEKVWQALTDSKIIGKWGGGPAEMDDKAGTKFSLWGGDIYGTNIEVEPFKRLVQEWYQKVWKEPSILTIKLFKNGNVTKIEILHENIPDKDYEDINKGWNEYYFGPLKEFAENNL